MTLSIADASAAADSVDLSVPWGWEFDPVIGPLLLALSAAYVAGLLRQRRERRLPRAATARAAVFALAVVLLVITFMSPLDAWGDHLFAAHMTQHLILMMVAPPLLVLSRPVVVGLWALPAAGRKAVGVWWLASRGLRPLFELIRSPLAAWILASAALWFWHLPRPYVLAFDNPWAHTAEHLSFFVTSILFWRIVIKDPQSSRLSLGATMIFVVTFAMENAMLAAVLIFAPHVLYPVHAVLTPWSPLTPLEDQQLAGVLMWAVTGVVDLVALCLLFTELLANKSGRRAIA